MDAPGIGAPLVFECRGSLHVPPSTYRRPSSSKWGAAPPHHPYAAAHNAPHKSPGSAPFSRTQVPNTPRDSTITPERHDQDDQQRSAE